MKAFCAFAFGGPNKYSGLDLNRAHQRLREGKDLSESHFDIMMGHMKAALRRVVPAHIPDRVVEYAIAALESHKSAVLGQSVDKM